MKQELKRNVIKWGNSAGVLLPREWIGSEAKVILIDRSLEIKKEVFSILDSYLEDVLGIYLVGSYARGEQTEKSDVDVIVISKNIRKEIISGKYHISIITLESAKKAVEKSPIMILPRLVEARVILNLYLLEELKNVKLTKKLFKEFIEGTKRIMKISKEFIELDKLDGDVLESVAIICSLMLRLRGIFLARCLLNRKKYLKKDFLRWLGKELKDVKTVYEMYEDIRDDKKIKKKIKIDVAEELLGLLSREVKKW